MTGQPIYKTTGALKSLHGYNEDQLRELDTYYQSEQKANIALTAASMWYGGDYFEFGSHDVNTFRNMLTAYYMTDQCRRFDDVRFYAFDIFGKLDDSIKDSQYFQHYAQKGDVLQKHREYISEHGLYVDRCHLIQGKFEETCAESFKNSYGDRKIGFAFLDCNLLESYKIVFDFILDIMATNSYIYMDEYFCTDNLIDEYDNFCLKLKRIRGIKSAYMRNCAGNGALFRLYG